MSHSRHRVALALSYLTHTRTRRVSHTAENGVQRCVRICACTCAGSYVERVRVGKELTVACAHARRERERGRENEATPQQIMSLLERARMWCTHALAAPKSAQEQRREQRRERKHMNQNAGCRVYATLQFRVLARARVCGERHGGGVVRVSSSD